MTPFALGDMHIPCGSSWKSLPLVIPQNENSLKYALKDQVQRTVLKTCRTHTLQEHNIANKSIALEI